MLTGSDVPNLNRYLTVGAAAELLGVCVATLRRWDRADKFKAIRHPVNGYRLYDREELLSLLTALRPAGRRDAGLPEGRGGQAR